jgi:hypothetical protein
MVEHWVIRQFGFGQKRGDLTAFEKGIAELAAKTPRKMKPVSFYVSIEHYFCQLKQSRGGDLLNIDQDLEIPSSA